MKKTVWQEDSTRTKSVAVRWYDPETGKKQRHLCANKADANTYEAEKVLWLKNWKPGSAATDKSPLALLVEHLRWGVERADKPWRPATLLARKTHVRLFIERPSVRTAADFTLDEVDKWTQEMRARGNAQGTVHSYLKELRGFLNWCARSGYIPKALTVKVPTCPNGGTRIPLDKVEAILTSAPNWMKAYLVVLANTGARKSELIRADWEDIDLHRWAWNIPAHKSKSNKARTIPLGEPEQAALLSILGGQKTENAVGPVCVLDTPLRGRRRIDQYAIKRGWKQAKKRAGITGKVRIHDLRHTFASNFRGRWDSLKKLCGWTTDYMASLYTHTLYEELKEDKNRFGVNLGWSGVKRDNIGQ